MDYWNLSGRINSIGYCWLMSDWRDRGIEVDGPTTAYKIGGKASILDIELNSIATAIHIQPPSSVSLVSLHTFSLSSLLAADQQSECSKLSNQQAFS